MKSINSVIPRIFVSVSLAVQLTGCVRRTTPVAPGRISNGNPVVTSKSRFGYSPAYKLESRLPAGWDREAEVDGLLLSLRKRVIGRKTAFNEIARVAADLRPLVDAAVMQPSVQTDLNAIALDAGISLDEERRRWEDTQEADLLLEAGGDPDAVSVSNAVGVAQWLASPARSNGLHVDLRESRRLSAKIVPFEFETGWLKYRAVNPPAPFSQVWEKGVTGSNPVQNLEVRPRPQVGVPASDRIRVVHQAPRPPATGVDGGAKAVQFPSRTEVGSTVSDAPAISPMDAARELPHLMSELEMLKEKRRLADQRYDPRAAIFAQTRYLARLYSRLPSVDWLYQAYHGGEAGAKRLIRAYLGSAWPGSAEAAIRYGRHGLPLTFQDLYATTSPGSHADAFAYLYGRGDDHRHYWWKVRVAADALADYRSNANGFRQAWESLLPGRMMDAVWYPDGPVQALADNSAVTAARQAHRLVGLPASTQIAVRPPSSDPQDGALYACLRPESVGALLLISAAVRSQGVPEPLRVGDLTLPQSYLDMDRRLHPPKPRKGPQPPPDPNAELLPGGGPPSTFDYHTTGLAFDLLCPAKPRDFKVLAWVIETLEARGVLNAVVARDRGDHRLHVIPNPRFQPALARITSPAVAAATWSSTIGTSRLVRSGQ